MYDIIIVGAGLSGATIAEHAARDGAKVLIIEKREHIGGNVYDEVDQESGIRISKYGAHLFHTNDDDVWNYVQQFGPWKRWDHKVVMDISGTYVPVPVTITTVNTLCGTTIEDEKEMKDWYSKNCIPNENPQNSEEVALSRVGPQLYEAIFKPYTRKQWNKEPKELDPSVLSRIPVRYNHDERYFSDKYQGLPVNGYTSIVQNMLSNPNIEVRCNTDWSDIKDTFNENKPIVIFTGPIDVYFKDSGLAPLEYRSIEFHWTKEKNTGYYQPNSVVNYSDSSNPYTRCVEYKHFLHQKSEYTIYSKEIPCDTGEPYYPIPTKENQDLYQKYVDLSKKDSNVHFIGRLASYKYFNMDQAIRNAMEYYRNYILNQIKVPIDVKITYKALINEYMEPFKDIQNNDIIYLEELAKTEYDLHHFKIVNNKLYLRNYNKYKGEWETRIEATKHLLLSILKEYRLKDVEFIIYTGDGINLSEYSKKITNNYKAPLFISTSILDGLSGILCPDFTFSFFPGTQIYNHEKMCQEIIDYQNTIVFKDKISKLVWRGSGDNTYRSLYLRSDSRYDVKSVLHSNENTPNYLSRIKKSLYKYQLSLNGHMGNDIDGAYSSSLKWALMSNQVVFYSAPVKYREFWFHDSIFKENEHYLYTNNPVSLDNLYSQILEDDELAMKIAKNGFDFFKKYLYKFDTIVYYMKELLEEYSSRCKFPIKISDEDQEVLNLRQHPQGLLQ